MTYQPTPAQLDGLVKCGAILDWQAGFEIVMVKLYETGEQSDWLEPAELWDCDILTAHLKRFAIEKAKERFASLYMWTKEETVGCFDIKHFQIWTRIGNTLSNRISIDIEANTELEAIIEAVLAVCEVK